MKPTLALSLIFWSVAAGTVVASVASFSYVREPVAPNMHWERNTTHPPHTTATSPDANAAATPAAFDRCAWRIIRDAPPQWMNVRLDGASVDIPYSDTWHVENPWCRWGSATYSAAIYQVYTHEDTAEKIDGHFMSFGRPADDVTSFDPEYILFRHPLSARDPDTLPGDWSCGSPAVETPLRMTIGGVKAWRYYEGGAKWCAMFIQFVKGSHLYVLERNLEPKFDTVVLDGKHAAAWDKAMTDIDAETRRIIESIKD